MSVRVARFGLLGFSLAKGYTGVAMGCAVCERGFCGLDRWGCWFMALGFWASLRFLWLRELESRFRVQAVLGPKPYTLNCINLALPTRYSDCSRRKRPAKKKKKQIV